MKGKPKNYALEEGRIISESELKQVLKITRQAMEHAASTRKNLHVISDHFLISFTALTGLRASEVCGLQFKDIHENSLTVIGKQDRKRIITLGRRGKALLKEFLEIKTRTLRQGIGPSDFLFTNRLGNLFSRFSANERFRFWVKRAGIDQPYSFHSLRHYFATHCLNHGLMLHEVQRMLGHTSIAMTAHYLHHTAETQDRINAVL